MDWLILWTELFLLAFTALLAIQWLLRINEDGESIMNDDNQDDKHNPDKQILKQILAELKIISGLEQQNANGIALLVGVLVRHYPSSFIIKQLRSKPLQGDDPMAVTGIVLGQTGTFQEVPLPAGSVFPAGTTFTWFSDDTLTTLTPSADGTQAAVATSASDTATSFNLTCTSSFTPPGGPAPLVSTVNVPLLPVPVPTPTDMTINQIS